MDVYGVRPITCEVGEEPLLHAVLLHLETEGLRGLATCSSIAVAAIEELAIDGPLTVQSIKLERADDPRRSGGVGQLVEGGIRCRIHAVVLDCRSAHAKLQDQVLAVPKIGRQDRVRVSGATEVGALRAGTVLREQLAVQR